MFKLLLNPSKEDRPMSFRPTPVTVAAVLLGILSLLNLAWPLFLLEAVPAVVVYGGVVLGIVGLVAAGGLWVLKRWGAWLAVVVSALNLLAAAPGIAFPSNGALWVAATVTVLFSALIIVLVLVPASRRAFATS
jgi:uncharacterized membrane protein (DUF2068 family)